jgi:hypothetical protein
MPRLGLSSGSKVRGNPQPSIQLYRDSLATWGNANANFVSRQWFCSGSSSLVVYGNDAGGEGVAVITGNQGRHILTHFDCQKNGSTLTNGLVNYNTYDNGVMYAGGGQIVYGGIYGHGLYKSTGYRASGYPPVFSDPTWAQDSNGWTRYRPVDTEPRKIILEGSSVAGANGVYYRTSGGATPFTKIADRYSLTSTTPQAASIFNVAGDGWYLYVDGIGNVAKNTTSNIDPDSWLPWTGGATGITGLNFNEVHTTIPNGKELRVTFTLQCFGASILTTDLNGLRVGLYASTESFINYDNHSNDGSAFYNYTGYMASYGTRHRILKRRSGTLNFMWTTSAYDQKYTSNMQITTSTPAFRITLVARNSNNYTTFTSSIRSLNGNGSISGDTSLASFTELTNSSMCFDTLGVAATSGVMDSFKVSDVSAEII